MLIYANDLKIEFINKFNWNFKALLYLDQKHKAWLEALAALEEDLGSIQSTHMVAHNQV